jgi:PleD family two-component response regulator
MEPLPNHDYRKKQSIELCRPVRVLLIDDSVFTLHGLRSVLSKKSGMVIVSAAKTESEAFAALQTRRTDVVVLDVQVGEASGIDLCRTIRESYPNTAVLFLPCVRTGTFCAQPFSPVRTATF